MLERLRIKKLGLTDSIEIKFSKRLNIITGDNSMGKTFILDIAWKSLTKSWTQNPQIPGFKIKDTGSSFNYTYSSLDDNLSVKEMIELKKKYLTHTLGRLSPGLIFYAQADGGFAVWDPVRNDNEEHLAEEAIKPHSFQFSKYEVWNGAFEADGRTFCKGLIYDWADWQREKGEAFNLLSRILTILSPSIYEPFISGPLTRVSPEDVRDHPTSAIPYLGDVALIYLGEGMRRIISLAYMLVWSWLEHLKAVELFGGAGIAKEIVFLMDELGAFLNPEWLKRIIRMLLRALIELTGEKLVSKQLIMTTHSPLVLASAESILDEKRDSIWRLEIQQNKIQLAREKKTSSAE